MEMSSALNTLDDLKGNHYGMLTVVERAPNDRFGTVYWRCVCECGREKITRGNTLRAGKFFTCGRPICRFWSKVHRPEGEGCWEWIGPIKDTGYGVFHVDGKNVPAHVYSWTLVHGPVPPGLGILHRCDNRPCVREDHLFPGTHQDNMDDMKAKGRTAMYKKVLSYEERLAVLVDVKGGLTQVEVSRKYGIAIVTVRRVVNRLLALSN
jgi:hypothetical protein